MRLESDHGGLSPLDQVGRRAHEDQPAKEWSGTKPGILSSSEVHVLLETVNCGSRDGSLIQSGQGGTNKELGVLAIVNIAR